MRVLGIEGTAHTAGVGIVEDDASDPARCRVLANRVDMLRPAAGGIHPREAADHHVEVLPALVRAALDEAGCTMAELDAVAFSQGPGLGPCLRTVATTARALALRHALPLAGVNHCVAHLEVGRATTAAADPVMLYASGANTQVIAEARNRYRVFGETLDVGIGNALDKFAREHGQPFPGGPVIERHAAAGRAALEESGGALPLLPYSVKGMDVSFSGIVTAARALVDAGTPFDHVCHAIQETAFAMLVEVTERAMAHTGKDTVILGGGVGRNQRLQGMLRDMAHARGGSFHCPEPALLSDNGAMIAWNGLLMVRSGNPTPLAASKADQRYRTDEVPLLWRDPFGGGLGSVTGGGPETLAVGAEASIRTARFLDRAVVLKQRLPKTYRHDQIETRLMRLRMRHEARLMTDARQAGLRVPAVVDADPEAGTLVIDEVGGQPAKRLVEAAMTGEATAGLGDVFRHLGHQVGRLHRAGIVHGDLTTSNVLVDAERRPHLIDFGLAERSVDNEARAVDLHVLAEALGTTHPQALMLWERFLHAYQVAAPPRDRDDVMRRLRDLEARGRYRSMLG